MFRGVFFVIGILIGLFTMPVNASYKVTVSGMPAVINWPGTTATLRITFIATNADLNYHFRVSYASASGNHAPSPHAGRFAVYNGYDANNYQNYIPYTLTVIGTRGFSFVATSSSNLSNFQLQTAFTSLCSYDNGTQTRSCEVPFYINLNPINPSSVPNGFYSDTVILTYYVTYP